MDEPICGERLAFLTNDCVVHEGSFIRRDRLRRAISQCLAGWACYEGKEPKDSVVEAERVGIALKVEEAIDWMMGKPVELYKVAAPLTQDQR